MSERRGKLHTKVAIVTGGSMGLGEGIVRKFIEEDSRVVIFDINADLGRKLVASSPGNSASFFEGDVTDEQSWEAVLEHTLKTFGQLDVVVNNAGVVHRSAPSNEVPLSEYDRIMKINVSPLYHSAKIIFPHFKAQGHGVFVNVSSISAPRPRPNLVWYAGSKGAVSAITKGLAAEGAPFGVRCNAICPAVAETGMVSSVLGGTDTPEGRTRLLAQIPMGRIGEPRDIGNAAAFLASEESSFITGIELPVDGGRSLI
ncbi:hypothetical protein DOTSEDRAFT_75457 [Dothistroma septosporum NZE10]|uniref:Versicolorin reductase 1 n=1 Tax=Dothistroma septosporum (strain NZE10 / CBS 128990) TaxID=675120 RepID=M2WI80_DOTSN|nr:hypothetical protein DOTSEDRAFT_75457 [Dothistroma septosporum NZE10]